MNVLVVGSGASGVHFALSALRKGHRVVMVDVGHPAPPAEASDLAFDQLRARLEDPARYFLGPGYEAVVSSRDEHEYYGFPPGKEYVFRRPAGFAVEARGFEPLFSFARGGLAEAWTGGAYPLNDAELADFPFDAGDLAPHYGEVARRIGVTGVKDDLAQFLPLHDHLLEPTRLDEHSAHLLTAYERSRDALNRLGCWLGRSRVAVLTVDREGRRACTYTGRCLWGCPTGALYTPSQTLEECRRYAAFTYLPGTWASHFEDDGRGRIVSLVVHELPGWRPRKLTADRFVLAAGTLGSSAIYLNTFRRSTGEAVRLPGLMDNRQALVPFVTLRMIGRAYQPRSYQYHQLALAIPGADARHYVHGQITTLKTALAHPILRALPLDLRTATALFRNVRAGLGLVNLNFADSRRETCAVSLRPEPGAPVPRLVVEYAPPPGEPARIRQALRTLRRALRHLGCLVPPWMTHVRPMGASVHYAGTIPMAPTPGPHTASARCRSHRFQNLWLVDGTTFPSLPAKNLTFTLMANAVRVAELEF
jgi:choline dehydrogenase-like flavoprotein